MQGESTHVPDTHGRARHLFQNLLNGLSVAGSSSTSVCGCDTNRSIGLQLSLLQHELRTPLVGILGMTSLLLDKEVCEESRQQLLAVQESGRQLDYLLSVFPGQKAVFARTTTLGVECFDGPDLLECIVRSHWPRAQDKGLRLFLAVDPGVPSLWHGNAAALRLILDNLLANAVKFTDNGRVLVEVCRAPAADSGRTDIQLRVTDTGCGIGRGAGRKIYAINEQGSPEILQRYGGQGIGLFVCQEICQQLGASLEYESGSGHGTSFTVLVPDLLDGADETEARPVSALLRGLCIGLAVNEALREPLTRMLRRGGVEVYIAPAGKLLQWPTACTAIISEVERVVGLPVMWTNQPMGELLLLFPHGDRPGGAVDGLRSRGISLPLLPSSLERMLLQLSLEQKIASMPDGRLPQNANILNAFNEKPD